MDTRRTDPDAEPPLLAARDGSVRRAGIASLVCECDGGDLDVAARGVGTFALVAAAIVGGLALARVAPRPIAFVALVWATCAVAALALANRHARRHGTFVLDFAAGTLVQTRRGRLVRRARLADVRAVHRVDAGPAAGRFAVAPRWLELSLGDGARVRIARGMPWELDRVERALDELGLPARQSSRSS